jgi:hypothetical protein
VDILNKHIGRDYEGIRAHIEYGAVVANGLEAIVRQLAKGLGYVVNKGKFALFHRYKVTQKRR